MTCNRSLRLGAAVTAALVLAACSGTAGSTPSPSPTPGLAAAPDVVGHNTCRGIAEASDNAPGRLACDQVASDARLSGPVDVTYQEVSLAEGALVWGTASLTNDGGAWQCKWVALRSPVGFHSMDFSCEGHEGYDGLWAYYQQEGEDDYAAFSGWIEFRR
jgi:hypothetical protein